MSRFGGFFALGTPADLLKKLRHDFSYAAFDFFVTAEHLLDWKYPDDGVPPIGIRKRTFERTSLCCA